MAHRISAIVPFLFITLLCLGIVEGGYLALEYFLMKGTVDGGNGVRQTAVKKGARSEAPQQKHDYRVILQRNLFGSSSTPATTEVVANGPATDLVETSLEIVLKGTISRLVSTRSVAGPFATTSVVAGVDEEPKRFLCSITL